MLYRKWFTVLSLFVIAALLLSACRPISASSAAPSAQDSAVPIPDMPRSDAPPYGLRGPHAVGVRDFVIEPAQEGERPINVTVWYPASNPDGRTEAETYMLNFSNPDYPDFAIAGRALRDAEADASGKPYPLIVYSHGYWLFRQMASYLMEQLASWGFVVIAGDHEDNWGTVFGPSQADTYVSRPQDIRRQIDFAGTLSAADGAFPGLIDHENVGVVGHSFGADTALLMGGARLNTDLFFNEWCAMNPGDPTDSFNDCAAMPALLDGMAKEAGLDAPPEGLWPDWSDPRVAAIVPFMPAAQYFGADGLATVRTPILLVEAEMDWALAAANQYYKPYTLLPTDPKTHLFFKLGDHGLPENNCEAMPGLVDMGFAWFCDDPVWDGARAHDLINHFVTAFMLAELKGDADAAAALAPESVDFRGIEYETTAFGAE